MRDGSVWLAALLAIAVTISGLTGPLRAQTGEPLLPEGPWVQVETEGFVLLGNAPEERLQSLATDAERFREAIRQVAPGIRLHTPEPARVFAFRDADTFQRLGLSAAFSTRAGVVSTGDLSSYFVLNAHPKVNATRFLYNEYVHHLLRINASPAPAWLRFGLAALLDDFQVIDEIAYVGRPRQYAWKIGPGELLPISELVALAQPVDTDPSFEYQSEALLRFLLFGNAATRRVFGSYLRKLYGGEPPGRAFRETLSEHLLADPRVQVTAFVARPVEPHPVFRVQEMGAVEVTTRPVEPAEVLSRVGILLLELDPKWHPSAGRFLHRAVELDPEQGTANLGLAGLAQRSGDPGTALLHAEVAVQHLPDDATAERARAHLLFGSAILGSLARRRPRDETERAQLERAREALRRSKELNPENPRAWTELVIAYGLAPEPLPEELEVVTEAMERFPDRIDLVSNAVLAHGRRGDREAAEALYRRLEEMGANPPTLTRAREVLLRLAFYEADRLIRRERHDDAIGLFGRIQSQTTDPRLRQQVTDRIALLERAEEYNRFIDRLLESQERMANGDLQGAAVLLDELRQTARPGKQTEVVEALVERLAGLQAEPRRDGARPR